jgi:hypothetical protein
MFLTFSPGSGTKSAESNDLGFFPDEVESSSGNAERVVRDKLLTRSGAVHDYLAWPRSIGDPCHETTNERGRISVSRTYEQRSGEFKRWLGFRWW